jgi:hypothetical protein
MCVIRTEGSLDELLLIDRSFAPTRILIPVGVMPSNRAG